MKEDESALLVFLLTDTLTFAEHLKDKVIADIAVRRPETFKHIIDNADSRELMIFARAQCP